MIDFKMFLLNVHPDPDTLGAKTVYDALDEIAKLAEHYLKHNIELNTPDFLAIMGNIETMIDKPLIDARFGDKWKSHQKQQLDEGFITNENILDIAWRQGRKSLLLERAVKELLQKIEFIQDQQKRSN